jgi:PAS domain S-box-containing protein
MTVESNHSPDIQDHSSDSTSTDLLSMSLIQQTFVSRFAPFLYLFLMVYGAVILISNSNPPEYFVILGLFSINMLEAIINKRNYTILRLVSSLFAIGVASILFSFAIDPTSALIAFFYVLVVFYSFALISTHHYVFLTVVAITFTLSFLAKSPEGGIGELIARLSLIFVLGGAMSLIRSVVFRAILDRTRLLGKLRQARDDYAQQLQERTAELQQEIQQHKQTESKLAEGHQLLQTIIDTFPSRLFVKDRDSRFTMVNRQSLKHLQLDDKPDAIVGKSDFDFYPHFAERTFADEQHLMETGEPIIDLEEKVLDNDGVERYYLISKVPMRHPETDEIVGLVGVTTDITSVKEIQRALQESQESLRQFQLRLKALNQITLALTRIETLDELVYQSIQSAITHLGFSRLNCWFINPENPEELVGSYWVNHKGDIVSSKDEVLSLDLFESAKQVVQGEQTNYVMHDTPIYDKHLNPIGHGDKAFLQLI